jgi:hypothetical protein
MRSPQLSGSPNDGGLFPTPGRECGVSDGGGAGEVLLCFCRHCDPLHRHQEAVECLPASFGDRCCASDVAEEWAAQKRSFFPASNTLSLSRRRNAQQKSWPRVIGRGVGVVSSTAHRYVTPVLWLAGYLVTAEIIGDGQLAVGPKRQRPSPSASLLNTGCVRFVILGGLSPCRARQYCRTRQHAPKKRMLDITLQSKLRLCEQVQARL